MKSNVSVIHDCYGCGVCASSCPVKVIDIELNKNGFYEPVVHEDKCIDCGLCIYNCAFTYKELCLPKREIKAWGAWSDDSRVRQICSSGGVGFEICRQLIQKGYKVIACRYNEKIHRAEHYIATSEIELIDSIGSKYIQSYTPDAFSEIKRGEKYVIVGTPCQIDSLRHMAKRKRIENDIVFIDFFCHCVPSMFAWQAYLKMVQHKIGDVKFASWRNKLNYGWHDSWIMNMDNVAVDNFDFKEHKGKWISRKSTGDLFYRLFLGDVTMNPACSENCKYKLDNSSADLRIGDFWGERYNRDEKGVSVLVSFTAKGEEIISGTEGITLESVSFDVATEGQLKKNAHPKTTAPVIMYLLKHNVQLDSPMFKVTFLAQKIRNRIKKYTGK